MNTPSHYNAIPLNVYKDRVTHFSINKPIHNSPAKVNPISPVTYKEKEAWFATQSPKSVSCIIGKTKKETFTDIQIRRTKGFPGIGKYDITKADNRISKGIGKSYK